MKKRVLAMACSFMLLMGSSMTVCAEETPTAQTPLQNYQQMMTPEILASFESLSWDMEDEEAMAVMRSSLVLRTDIWGELQDADGDGIDDRDPINGCGYVDLNYNGFDDRFEMALINMAAQEDVETAYVAQVMLTMLTHRCEHGVTASAFEYDEDMGYWSRPDYFFICPVCAQKYENLADDIIEILQPYFS